MKHQSLHIDPSGGGERKSQGPGSADVSQLNTAGQKINNQPLKESVTHAPWGQAASPIQQALYPPSESIVPPFTAPNYPPQVPIQQSPSMQRPAPFGPYSMPGMSPFNGPLVEGMPPQPPANKPNNVNVPPAVPPGNYIPMGIGAMPPAGMPQPVNIPSNHGFGDYTFTESVGVRPANMPSPASFHGNAAISNHGIPADISIQPTRLPAPSNFHSNHGIGDGIPVGGGMYAAGAAGVAHPSHMPAIKPQTRVSPPGVARPPQRKTGTTYTRRYPAWMGITLATLSVLLVTFGVLYAYYQANYAESIDSITGHKAIRPKIGNNASTAQTGNDNFANGGRVNILLLGSDNDGKGGNDVTPLAQTNIIVTIDPATKQVGMLSIPRDMQVTDPVTMGHPKLDEVFSGGSSGNTQADRIAASAGRSMATIEYNYGIHIDHYAWVGLDGFIKVIDTAGGVDIDAIHPMVDDVYPDDVNNKTGVNTNYKRLYIAPGPQHMNGQQALEYVRTRHSDLIGDFGRSARQQQILSDLKIKLDNPDIINKAPDLLKDMKNSLYTDLTLDQIIPMANFARGIDLNHMRRVTLSPPYSSPASMNTNYMPNCDQITPVISDMFKIQGKCVPQDGPLSRIGGQLPATVSPNAASGGVAMEVTRPAAQPNLMQASTQQVSSVYVTLPNFSAVRSLLDLMFIVVFESLEAIQV